VKARAVKGLDPDATLADNLERIVATRLDELCSFIPRALDPARIKALHDMRIAAKRLRYILEVAAEPCFGPYATAAIKRTRDLQDLLGELHDCDVQLPRVRALQDELRAADALEARARDRDAVHLRRSAQRTALRALPRAVARARARGLPPAPALRDRRAARGANAAFTI
jgi:CHAD domain-containing protein